MENQSQKGARSAARPGKRADRPVGGFQKGPMVKKARWVARTPQTEGGAGAKRPYTPRTGASKPYTPRTDTRSTATPRPYSSSRSVSTARPYTPRTTRPETASTARPYTPRPSYQSRPTTGGARPYSPRPASSGGRPYTPRPSSGASRPYTPRTSASASAYPRPEAGARPYTPRPAFAAKKTYAPRGDARYGGALSRPKIAGPSVPSRPARTTLKSYEPKNGDTSWGEVATWYDKHLNSADTYHEKVILPNLLRLVEPKKGEVILDLACGQGYFTRALNVKGVKMTGVDISKELIQIAEQESTGITYHVAPADKLTMIEDKSVDKVVIVLAIQNIQHVDNVLHEVARILKPEGAFHITMNHPAFRIPKQSSWNYDDNTGVQYRRVDQYLSESKSEIEMHPGMKDSPKTISFHRSLQYYVKALSKAGFAIDRFEEWISHKDSDSGPRARAENKARKEIPLFLYVRAIRK